MHSVLDLDATLGSHPIVVDVETPDQITEIFDSITYSKGASIIRMIEDFVGPDNFRKGVTDYLNEMAYTNADSNDLLRNLKKYTSLDIDMIVNTWIKQKGIPVVTVEKTGGSVRLTQKRFFTDPENDGKETLKSDFNYKWSIPITYKTDLDSTVQRLWFHHTDSQLEFNVDASVKWIKVNVDQVGYYRVKYDQTMWESLKVALKDNIDALSVVDRAHLLNDVFSLAQGQQVPYDTALQMTEFLANEGSFIPWDVASTKLKNIRNLLYNTEYYKKFLKYVNDLVDAAFTSVDWNVDNSNDKHVEK
jgi:glutamyl aminopeptidase